MSSEFQIAYSKEYRDVKEKLQKACGFQIDEVTKEAKVSPDAKLEDLMALMELNRAEAAAIQEGLRKKMAEGAKLANTAASFHDDKQLEGVLDDKK